jgi:hypothetical protein
MTATPTGPNATSQLGKAAGAAGVALGALVALTVAALFLLQTGADRNTRPNPRESHTVAWPRDIRASRPPRAPRHAAPRRRCRSSADQTSNTPRNE